MNDRRQVPRWQIQREAGVTIDDVESVSRGLVENINLKGMCLQLDERLPQGRDIRMRLSVEPGLVFDCEVRVPWVKEEDGRITHGMMFTRIKDADRENIYAYMSEAFPELLRHSWWDAPAA